MRIRHARSLICAARLTLAVLMISLLAQVGYPAVSQPGLPNMSSASPSHEPSELAQLIQLPSLDGDLMMGYLIRSADALLVIDGGSSRTAPLLRQAILEQGGHVRRWYLTHAHEDHAGALLRLADDPALRIDTLVCQQPDVRWVAEVEPDYLADAQELRDFLDRTTIARIDPQAGSTESIAHVSVHILQVGDRSIRTNAINNGSMVLRLDAGPTRVLFLGDLGVEGGRRLLREKAGDVDCAIVQMAHHGQAGVERAFYQAVSPQVALWPTPDWLWRNVLPDSKNDPDPRPGDWKTLEVRKWMDELQTVGYVAAHGITTVYLNESGYTVRVTPNAGQTNVHVEPDAGQTRADVALDTEHTED